MKPRATKYTVKHLDLTDSRTSPRNYTHVIVGRWAPSDAAIEAHAQLYASVAPKDYDLKAARVAAGVGGFMPEHFPGSHYPVSAEEFAEAVEFLAANPDRAAYIQSEAERGRSRLRNAAGTARSHVLQWSMSEKAARAAVGSWIKRGYSDVFVALTDQARGDAHGVSL